MRLRTENTEKTPPNFHSNRIGKPIEDEYNTFSHILSIFIHTFGLFCDLLHPDSVSQGITHVSFVISSR